MKKAYIILAHKEEAQVKRLVDTLDDGCSFFYLHIDLNANAAQFKKVFAKDQRVCWMKRKRTGWGTFGLVEATVNAMRAIYKTKGYDKVILLSGQDYPIKTNKEIDRFFENSTYQVFMDYFSLPNHTKWGSNGGMYRVNKYFYGPGIVEKYSAKVMNLLALFIPFLKRAPVGQMQPFSGSQWWAMDMRALNYIIEFVDAHPEYVRFHRNTFAADELFFQMILLNSTDQSIRESLSNNNLRFMKWSSPSVAHPEVLRLNDLDQLSCSSALFARKFDPEVDSEVINAIDRVFLQFN